ncbi:hypothetical protein [Microcoleus sp. B4-C1]|uniref:hypothetical protein n=1 Tax=Microcoleus sp. B4-C1 TaxID=2818660 RepID=UPI002FD1BAA9
MPVPQEHLVFVEQAGKPVADIGARLEFVVKEAIEIATIQTKFTLSGLTDKGDIKAVLCESMQKLGLFLFILSFLPWLAVLFVVPFLPLDITQKTT